MQAIMFNVENIFGRAVALNHDQCEMRVAEHEGGPTAAVGAARRVSRV